MPRTSAWIWCGAFLAFSCLIGQAPARAASGESPDDLVRRLGSSSFSERQRATLALENLGVPAKSALLEGLKSPDAEVRARCRRVLVSVLEQDCQARIDAFAADKVGGSDHGLPGWERFKVMVGETPATRDLFAEMQRAESALLESTLAEPKSASESLDARCLLLQNNLYRNLGGQPNSLSLGAIAALFFVAGNPEIAVTDRHASYLNNFSYQPALQAAMTSGPKVEPLRKLLGSWVARAGNGLSAYNTMMVAMRYDLKEALQPALAMCKQPGGQPHYLQYAILVVGKFGDKQHVPDLEPLLENSGLLFTQQLNGQSTRTEVRDVALAALIHLTGQEFKDYGMTRVQKVASMLFNPSSLGFADDKERETALKKWKSQTEPAAKG